MNPVLQIQRLSKQFGERRVLFGLDLDLLPGSTTVLLGANGTGKTTLMKLVLGLERADAGLIRVAGLDPMRDPSAVRARVGFVPDKPDVYPWMTPRDLFAFLRPQYPQWSRAIESRLVDRLAIPLRTSFAALSRGEAAKAMLVAALAPQPDLYLLDEAFSGLDPLVRDDVLAAFLEEIDLTGRAALVVTHELDLAARLADRVAILSGGCIVAYKAIDDLCNDGARGGTSGDRPRRIKQALSDAREGSAAG